MSNFLAFGLVYVSFLAHFAKAQGTPVVLWHGMGDSCCNPFSMGHIKAIIENNMPNGTHVYSVKIGANFIDDTVNGFLDNANDQVQFVCDHLASDPVFADGYHAMGFSQVSHVKCYIIQDF